MTMHLSRVHTNELRGGRMTSTFLVLSAAPPAQPLDAICGICSKI